MKKYDVVIVGGGPAGLSAALLLGRCRRKVLVYDHEVYRNVYSHAIHGFLTRDGIDPKKFRKVARDQLRAYPSVIIQNEKVVHAEKVKDGFILEEKNGLLTKAKMVLLATGIADYWPKIRGAKEMYGLSIFHCPYCDGWEMRDKPLAVLGKRDAYAGEQALSLLLWSQDVVLCSDGPSELSDNYREKLKKNHIAIREDPILELIGKEGILEKIVFHKGKPLKRRAIFFTTFTPQKSPLPAILGCDFDDEECVKVGKFESTKIPGLFVAGDASRDVLHTMVAASSGVEAAMAINKALIKTTLK